MNRAMTLAGAALAVSLLAACTSDDSAGPADATTWSDEQVRPALAQFIGEDNSERAELRNAHRATLTTAAGARVGQVVFFDAPDNGGTIVLVRAQLPGDVTPGRTFHGFHLHANSDPANGSGCQADPKAAPSTWFTSADGHYAGDTPGPHGTHAGDMPAVFVNADGRVSSAEVIGRVAPEKLAGLAVVLHAKGDNFGSVPTGSAPEQYTPNGPAATDLTARTGNAGDRIACGVVGRYEG